MGWSEIIKAVNSNISVPLNKLITSAKDSLDASITNVKSGVDTSITSAKNELSTLIKKNGASYPNVIAGILEKGKEIEITGKGKISVMVSSSGVEVEFRIDGELFPTTLKVGAQLQTVTFEKSIYLLNKTTSSDSAYFFRVCYLLQLTE